MTKIDAGLLSFGASGTIGKTMTFSSWKGRPYVRRRVIPSNPRTGGQTGVRAGMKWGSRAWANLGSTPQSSWDSLAAATNISPFNAFIGTGQRRLRDGNAYQQSNPAATAADTATVTSASATAEGRNIILAWTDPVTAGFFGVHIYRALATGFSIAPNNLIAIVDVGAEGYIDGPLVPDEYFYMIVPFNIEGEVSTNETEVDATVS
ncbi:MAG TPA: hypothetical protein VNO50_12765 [Pyrinomonadaceae bacterium]|nr:hypothetical protein [Pyrinomonadaceae bacterium]